MSANPPSRPARPWQPRFTILGMMLTTLVVAVAAAAVSYLVRLSDRRSGHLLFLIITLAGPLILVIAVSLIRAAIIASIRLRKQKQKR